MKRKPEMRRRAAIASTRCAAKARTTADQRHETHDVTQRHENGDASKAWLPLGAMLMTSLALTPVHSVAQNTARTQSPAKAQKDGKIVIAQAAETVLPSVQVDDTALRETTGYQATSTSIGKIKQAPRDIPQSLTIVPRQLMTDTNADSLKQALANVPGLTFNAGEGGRIGDNFTLRGYSVIGDLYLDGMRDIAQYNREVFNLEAVEVLRGSASMLFGRGSTGGVINQVSKVPLLEDRYRVAFTYGSYDYKRVTADLNKAVGETTAIRLNAMKTDADSFRNAVHNERWGVAPSVAWGIGTRNEFTLAYYRLEDDNIPDYGVPYYLGKPLPVPVDRFYGMANADYDRNQTGIATATYVHRFDQDTSLRTVLRKADYYRDLRAVAPRLNLASTGGILTDDTIMNRQRQTRGGEEHTITSQTDFTTRATTGSIGHLLLAGVELVHEDAQRWNYVNTGPNPTTTVGYPDPYPPIPPGLLVNTRTGEVQYTARTVGLYAQDMVELTRQWKVLLGARYDNFTADYDRPPPAGKLSRTDNVWSYRTGLIFQPDIVQSYYLAYGTSFNPSGELYALDARGANTPPEKSRNIELGSRWELREGDLMLRSALFRSEKTNERNTDLSVTVEQNVLYGKRHTDGIEFELAGRLTPRWEVFSGVAFMRANIDAATGQQANTLNKVPINTPDYTMNLWTVYQLGRGWKVGGGFQGAGLRYANATNTTEVPAYIRWDGLIAYEQPRYTLRLNVFNIFDRDYYEGVYQGHTIPGVKRLFQVTAELKF